MIKYFVLISFIFSISGAWGKILKHQISKRDRSLHSYKEVCQKMGVNHLLIVNPHSTFELDCMGKLVNVQDFCLKEHKDDGQLLRGFISKAMGEVVCERGSALELSLSCDKAHLPYCEKPKLGCSNLGQIFAVKHELKFHSLIPRDVDDTLNCYFTAKLDQKLNENEFKIDPDILESK